MKLLERNEFLCFPQEWLFLAMLLIGWTKPKKTKKDILRKRHLSKKWLLTYAFGVNLMDMKIRSQSLKLYRDLHCWEFMFTWWPTGYTKGFQLSINIKHPDLKDIRLRSSSSNRKFMSN